LQSAQTSLKRNLNKTLQIFLNLQNIMKKHLNKWPNSNYEIIIDITADEHKWFKDRILKKFSKDMKIAWFRPGHIPLHIVEKNIQPHYIKVGIYEETINKWLQEILEENKDIKFMWEPYDINDTEKNGDITLSFKLDVYPEVKVKDDKRSKENIKEINTKIDKKEINDAMINLKKNYADYKDTDSITEKTVSKITIQFLDKDGKEIDKWSIYIGEPEFEEFDFFKKTFLKKKKNDNIEISYKEKDLPPTVKYTKWDSKNIKKISFTIKNIKEIVLPEMTEENIKKLFGNETEVKTEKELESYIEKNLTQSKRDNELVKTIEEYINTIKEKSFEVTIPKTIIDEEQKTRLKSMEQRFGGKEKLEEYFKNLWEEKAQIFRDDIRKSAKESLEKFFILQKAVKLLKIDVDRKSQEQLHVEKKLYEKLSGKKYDNTTKQAVVK